MKLSTLDCFEYFVKVFKDMNKEINTAIKEGNQQKVTLLRKEKKTIARWCKPYTVMMK
jgi:hypothetical protein